MSSAILTHILGDKFSKSSNAAILEATTAQGADRTAGSTLTLDTVRVLLRHIIQQKFEQRELSDDLYDDYIRFLSGEQDGIMEISYTKQQQKQKQKQNNKNQDSDTMDNFRDKNQLNFSSATPNYFEYTLTPETDTAKIQLSRPLEIPIFKVAYTREGKRRYINVFPTLQFLYSHHIHGDYITGHVKKLLSTDSNEAYYKKFFAAVEAIQQADSNVHVSGYDFKKPGPSAGAEAELGVETLENKIRQSPLYTLAALSEGVYVIGMKDQFNIHDLPAHPLANQIQYVADEMGFILYDKNEKSANIDDFGPYFIEQYILMELLSKQEVAQNVLDYYLHQKDKLQRGFEKYEETQGKGFICWRFIHDMSTLKTPR